MTLKVVFEDYLDLCFYTEAGKNFIDLPAEAKWNLMQLFDGKEIDLSVPSIMNPSNLWQTYHRYETLLDMMLDLELISKQEYKKLVETTDDLEAFIKENEDIVLEEVQARYLYLGQDDEDKHYHVLKI